MASHARLFLEAISDHPEPAICNQRLVVAQTATLLYSLRMYWQFSRLLGRPSTCFPFVLEAPVLKTVRAGEVLRKVILRLIDTPLARDALVEGARSDQITGEGI